MDDHIYMEPDIVIVNKAELVLILKHTNAFVQRFFGILFQFKRPTVVAESVLNITSEFFLVNNIPMLPQAILNFRSVAMSFDGIRSEDSYVLLQRRVNLDELARKLISQFIFRSSNPQKLLGFKPTAVLFRNVLERCDEENALVPAEHICMLCLLRQFPHLFKSSEPTLVIDTLGASFVFVCLNLLNMQGDHSVFDILYMDIFRDSFFDCKRIFDSYFSSEGRMLDDPSASSKKKRDTVVQKEGKPMRKEVTVFQAEIEQGRLIAEIENAPGYDELMEMRQVDRFVHILICLFGKQKFFPVFNRQAKHVLCEGISRMLGMESVKDVRSYNEQFINKTAARLLKVSLSHDVNTVVHLICNGMFEYDYPNYILEPFVPLHNTYIPSKKSLPDFFVFGALVRTNSVSVQFLRRIKYMRLSFFLQFCFDSVNFSSFRFISPSAISSAQYVPTPHYTRIKTDDAIISMSKPKPKPVVAAKSRSDDRSVKKKKNVEIDDLFNKQEQLSVHERVELLSQRVEELVDTQAAFMKNVSSALEKMSDSLVTVVGAIQSEVSVDVQNCCNDFNERMESTLNTMNKGNEHINRELKRFNFS
ncbi:hypothetical protein PCE1_003937 [Barthelona sp. PCE]